MKIISSIKRIFTKTKPLQKATSEFVPATQKAEIACEELATSVTNEIAPKASQTVKYAIYSTKPRPVTEADKVVAQQYFYALKNKTHITQEEIKELFAKNYNDFVVGAYELILKRSGIPKSLHPPFMYANLGELDAGYNFMRNVVYIHPASVDAKKAELFNILNHELKHWRQNLDILRTENLGSQAIKTYASTCKEQLKNSTLKSIEQLAKDKTESMTDTQIKALKEVQRMYETNRKAFEDQFDTYYQSLVEQYSQFQKTVIEEIGLIKENSALARKSKMYFEDFQNATSDNLQNVDYGLYLTRFMEKEAYLTGDMAEAEVSGECLFSKLKKQYTAIQADKKLSEQLRKGNLENLKRYKNALGEE